MPNGRSGGFLIETADLKQLIATVSDSAVVGELIAAQGVRAASAGEISRRVAEWPHDRVAVEEQDKTSYIIHLGNEPEDTWFLINSESPIFAELRERHSRWMAEHPGWNGWIAF